MERGWLGYLGLSSAEQAFTSQQQKSKGLGQSERKRHQSTLI